MLYRAAGGRGGVVGHSADRAARGHFILKPFPDFLAEGAGTLCAFERRPAFFFQAAASFASMIVPVALPSTLWAKALATSSAGRPEEGSIFSASSVSRDPGRADDVHPDFGALEFERAKSAMSGSATGVAGVVSRVPAEQAQALQSGPKNGP